MLCHRLNSANGLDLCPNIANKATVAMSGFQVLAQIQLLKIRMKEDFMRLQIACAFWTQIGGGEEQFRFFIEYVD